MTCHTVSSPAPLKDMLLHAIIGRLGITRCPCKRMHALDINLTTSVKELVLQRGGKMEIEVEGWGGHKIERG